MVLTKDKLLDGLAQYGYSLLRPSTAEAPEVVLKNLVEQEDVRLMEGFPVVLANVLKSKTKLDWESKNWNPRHNFSPAAKERFVCLLALSYLLFKEFGLEAGFRNRTRTLLRQADPSEEVLKTVQKNFSESKPVKAGGVLFSSERLKTNFKNYTVPSVDDREVEKKKHELQLELLLSQLFTPKQKVLLKKKMAGNPLTKTEREYFSRVVKKRLNALANPEVHQMAVQLLNK